EAEKPNDLWQADHTQLDIWVREPNGALVRPWLTVVMDDYSRAIAGFRLSFDAPSSIQTALTLRQAIWRKAQPQWKIMEIPATFYSDNGSDFTSQHLEQVSADLHMVLVFSEPYIPRGRGKIERFFGTVNQRLLCGLPGYTPAGLPAAHAVLNAWCEILGDSQSTKSVKARRGRPRCSLNHMQKFCKAIFAAQRACHPLRAWGRPRARRKVCWSLSWTVSTIWRPPASQRRHGLAQGR